MKEDWRPWIVLAATILVQVLVVGASIYSFGIWAIPYLRDFDVPRSSIMACISLAVALEGFISPIVGQCLDRFPIRRNVLIGGLLMGAGMVLAGLTRSFVELLLVWALVIGPGGSFGGALMGQALVSKWFSSSPRRGLAVGLALTGPALGGIIMPMVITRMLPDFGWRITQMSIGAVIVIFVTPITLFILSDPPLAARHAQEGMAREHVPLRRIVVDPVYLATIFAFFPILFVYTGLNHNWGLLAKDHGVSDLQAGMLVSISGFGTMMGKILTGAATDKFRPAQLFFLPLSSVMLVLLLLYLSTGIALLIPASFFIGFTIGGFLPLIGAIGVRRFSVQAVGSFLGMVSLATPLAALAPIFFGWLRDRGGSYTTSYAAGVLILLISLGGARILKRSGC